ncbi:MAG TPA: glycosyltransferase family 2 protein [Gaiellaceae bacterium]|nr:glycosyltransferase family 2 protein [Gaiellaceae bacterium]
MRLDVVVVAYRSAEHLRACVAPLCGDERIRVFVVDNLCPESSPATVKDLRLTVVETGRNAGFGAGCNAGARCGSAPAILFLNPDAQLAPEQALSLAESLARDPALGAVGPRIVGADGSVHSSARRTPRLRSAFGEAMLVHRLVPRAQWATELIRDPGHGAEVEWLSGAALCVRRTAFEQIGGFDERFFLYSEDTDICVRLRGAGYRVRFDAAVTAVHAGGQSAPAARQERTKMAARLLYASIHESARRSAAFRAAYALHEAVRLPLAVLRSREHVRGRMDALAVVLSPGQRRARPPA